VENIIPGIVFIGGFFLVIAMGVVVLVKRLVYGRGAVENMPGWACWGTHLIFAFVGLLLGAYVAHRVVDWYGLEGRAAVAVMLLIVPFMIGGYFTGVFLVGEGKDPDELRRIEFEKRNKDSPRS